MGKTRGMDSAYIAVRAAPPSLPHSVRSPTLDVPALKTRVLVLFEGKMRPRALSKKGVFQAFCPFLSDRGGCPDCRIDEGRSLNDAK